MKACQENKTKTLLLGVPKILLAAYAVIKRIFKSSSLNHRNMSMVKQQAAGPQPGSFLLTMQLYLHLVGNGHGEE